MAVHTLYVRGTPRMGRMERPSGTCVYRHKVLRTAILTNNQQEVALTLMTGGGGALRFSRPLQRESETHNATSCAWAIQPRRWEYSA